MSDLETMLREEQCPHSDGDWLPFATSVGIIFGVFAFTIAAVLAANGYQVLDW